MNSKLLIKRKSGEGSRGPLKPQPFYIVGEETEGLEGGTSDP